MLENVDLKFMTSHTGKQIVTRYTFHHISKSKGNQTMKFGGLIEYSLRKIFLENSFTKYRGEASPKLFSEKIKVEQIPGLRI